MLGEDKIQSCFEHKEARCRIETCENTEIDPRSFCHNICAKPEHVCGEMTCEKFVSDQAHGGKVVCIPRHKCKLKRHFGPIEEEIIVPQRAKGANLESSPRDRSKYKKKAESHDDENTYDASDDDDDTTSDVKQQEQEKEEVRELLKNISEKIDSQGMAAIYALAGSDICPCCECKICQCKLRHVDSKTLQDIRKQALIKKKIKQEEEVLKLEKELKRKDLSKDEKQKILQKKIENENEYGYSFDYFYQPNLEAFEKERRIKQEQERQEEIEREKIAVMKEMEERQRQEEALLMKSKEEEAQAEPETAEEGSEAELDEEEKEEKRKRGSAWGEYKATEWAGVTHQDQPTVIEKATADAKARASINQRTSFDSAVSAASAPERVSEISETSYEATPPPPIPAQPSGEPQLDLQQLPTFDRSWLDDNEKLSVSKSVKPKVPPVVEPKTLSPETKQKQTIDAVADIKPETVPTFPGRRIRPPTAAETMKSMSMISTDSKVSAVSGISKASAVSAVGQEQKTDTASDDHRYSSASEKMPFLTDDPETNTDVYDYELRITITEDNLTLCTRHVICDYTDCQYFRNEQSTSLRQNTPNSISGVSVISVVHVGTTNLTACFCTCGEQHYTLKKDPRTEDFGMGFKQILIDRMISTKERRRMGDQIDGGSEFSEASSCSCIHSEDELRVTPVTSRDEVVAVPPISYIQPEVKKARSFVKCIRPRYQKTLIIVKPEAVQFKDVIFRAIKREGLDILEERLIHLTPEQVAEIYTENFGSAYFPMFVQRMSSAPILVIAIAGTNAIQRWNRTVGPEKKIPLSWFYPASMRRRFSVHKDILDVMKLSDDFEKAKTELRYFFPLNIIDPIIISSTMVQDYCDEFIHPTLMKGLHKMVQEKPADPISFLAEWLLINNPFQPFYKQKQVSLSST